MVELNKVIAAVRNVYGNKSNTYKIVYTSPVINIGGPKISSRLNKKTKDTVKFGYVKRELDL